MRHYLIAIALAAALSIGAAQAAPGFGASSHRLGASASEPSKKESRALSTFEAFLAIFGLDLAASVEPVAGESMNARNSKTKECQQAKKTDVAKAETKEGAEGASTKGKSRTGEPVYLAF